MTSTEQSEDGGQVTDLENEGDERGEDVFCKDRVKHSEMNDLQFLIWSWLMVETR